MRDHSYSKRSVFTSAFSEDAKCGAKNVVTNGSGRKVVSGMVTSGVESELIEFTAFKPGEPGTLHLHLWKNLRVKLPFCSTDPLITLCAWWGPCDWGTASVVPLFEKGKKAVQVTTGLLIWSQHLNWSFMCYWWAKDRSKWKMKWKGQ